MVSGFVTQCMVKSPVTLYLSPAFSTLLDLNDISGQRCTSKKSGDLRWPSRFSLLVLMLAGSIFTSTLLFARSSLSKVTVDEKRVKFPRTVVTIMCFTEKFAELWFGSASRVTGAARTAASKSGVIFGYLLGRSSNLPEFQHRGGLSTRGAIGLEHPLGERPP